MYSSTPLHIVTLIFTASFLYFVHALSASHTGIHLHFALGVFLAVGLFWRVTVSFCCHKCSRIGVGSALLVWLLVALVAGESIATLDFTRQGFQIDDAMGWKPSPHLQKYPMQAPNGDFYASTDAYGYRNTNATPGAAWYLQGDSNAMGFGLSDAQTLNVLLNERLGENTFYNLGVSGFDLHNMFFQYDVAASQFGAKKRVIVLNIGNDFTLSALKTPYGTQRPYLRRGESGEMQSVHLVNAMPVQAYGRRFIEPYTGYDHKIGLPLHQSWASMAPSFMSHFSMPQLLVSRFFESRTGAALATLLFTQRHPPISLFYPPWLMAQERYWPEPFRAFRTDFAMLLESIKHQQPETVVCVFPMRIQVIPKERKEALASLHKMGLSDTHFNPMAFNHYLQRTLEHLDLPLLDATPLFMARPDVMELYQPNRENHLSQKGLGVLAGMIHRHFMHHDATPSSRDRIWRLCCRELPSQHGSSPLRSQNAHGREQRHALRHLGIAQVHRGGGHEGGIQHTHVQLGVLYLWRGLHLSDFNLHLLRIGEEFQKLVA